MSKLLPHITFDEPESEGSYYPLGGEPIICTSDELLALYKNNIGITTHDERTIDFPDLNKTADQSVHKSAYYNTRVEVHASNSALMIYNEVEVFEDYCTDKLQEKLDEGYRILAVCVQPDQRRPDYILGRYTPNV